MMSVTKKIIPFLMVFVLALGIPFNSQSAQTFEDLFVKPQGIEVDVQLVLAVDVSHSIKDNELELQREGYAKALMSDEFLDPIKRKKHKKIAVKYFEWNNQIRHEFPWVEITDKISAFRLASFIRNLPYEREGSSTGMAKALEYAKDQLDSNGYSSFKKVIDISSDGVNNMPRPINVVQKEVLAGGDITINGLAIMLSGNEKDGVEGVRDYLEDCVIGGPGHFIEEVRSPDEFIEKIRRKMVIETGYNPGLNDWKIVPASWRDELVASGPKACNWTPKPTTQLLDLH